jgi:hypothetical protein
MEVVRQRIAAVEVANGGTLRAGFSEGPASGIPFWEKQLNQGFHLTAIGGSDNHDATDTTGAKQSPVGKPATVVWSDALSQSGILAGVRSGRVFIDLQNEPGRLLDMVATVNARSSMNPTNMGGTLALAPGASATLHVTLEGAPGATVELVSNDLTIVQSDDHKTATITHAQSNDSPKSGWVRANARDAAGNVNSANISSTIGLDTAPPSASTLSIANGANFTATGTVTLNLSFPTDVNGVAVANDDYDEEEEEDDEDDVHDFALAARRPAASAASAAAASEANRGRGGGGRGGGRR